MNFILLANAAISLLEQLLPAINGMVKSGQVTADEQAQLLARYQKFKDAGDEAFSGPEWVFSPAFDPPGSLAETAPLPPPSETGLPPIP
jgi:hypothetical protein